METGRHREEGLTRISHRLTSKAHDRPAITSLRLLGVLTVLFKYASLLKKWVPSGARLVLTDLSCLCLATRANPANEAGLGGGIKLLNCKGFDIGL